ncbi:hypothetical protein MMC30_002934 [Trapelia coarctata]|nr:hypothetical protein [Trapelia coarctata]
MAVPQSQSQAHENSYIFQRNTKSTIRLNYHHWIIKGVAGYLLNPVIPKPSPGVRVADIGTGTGIWAIELAGELPSSATIDAFDISPAQYPPLELMPANVHFHTHDAFTPFPEECLAQYDIVHIRFFLTLTNTENASSLIQNLLTLLKPGGYLQWFEPDMLTSKAIAPNPEVSKSATETMVSVMRKPTPTSEYNWVPRLGSMFSEHGLESVKCDRILMVDKYRSFMSQVHLMTYEEFCEKMEDAGMAEQAQMGRKAIDALGEEFRHGVSADTDHVCVVGRRPL